MIIFLIILLVLCAVFEMISLNTSFQNIRFEFHADRKSTEPDEHFYMIEKASNLSRLPVTYLRSRIIFPHVTLVSKDRALIMNRFERKSTQRFFLLPLRSVTRSVPMSLSERGVYWFEEADLERGDFLGLKSSFTRTWGYTGIVVLPKRLSDSRSVETLSGIVGDFLSKPFLLRDPILSYGVREYTGADPMKSISWKKTASSGRLMVREYDYTRERSCILCVLGSESALEEEMEIVSRIGRTAGEMLCGQNVQLHFFTNAYLQAMRPFGIYHAEAEANSMDSFLDLLARLRTGESGRLERLLDEMVRISGTSMECILIAPRQDEISEQFSAMFEKRTHQSCTAVYAVNFTEELR